MLIKDYFSEKEIKEFIMKTVYSECYKYSLEDLENFLRKKTDEAVSDNSIMLLSDLSMMVEIMKEVMSYQLELNEDNTEEEVENKSRIIFTNIVKTLTMLFYLDESYLRDSDYKTFLEYDALGLDASSYKRNNGGK